MNKPKSINTEKALLGSMILSKEALINNIGILEEDDFFLKEHQIILKILKDLREKRNDFDLLIVNEELNKNNEYLKISRENYLEEIMENVTSPSNAEQYVKILKEKKILRDLLNKTSKINEEIQEDKIEDVGEFVAIQEKEILSITRSRNVGGFENAKDVLKKLKEKMYHNAKHKGELTGIYSGFSELDSLTNGFQKGDLIILAARPSMGKTALALNFALNAATKTGQSIGIFSLEMPSEQLIQRMLSTTSNINGNKIRSLSLSENEWAKIDLAINTLSNTKIFIDDTPGAKLNDIQAKARKLKNVQEDLGLIVVDYLQLISVSKISKTENRQLEVGEISRGLKEMARELKVPVIALSQLSRAVEKRIDKRPVLSDLRESGSIEQDADIVMFIYRDEYYNREKEEKSDAEIVEINIAKHRNGPIGNLEVIFLKEYGIFSSKYKE